ncbi:MAG: Fe-S cluster assembly protein HesB [Frankiaceae bacterium]|nr:Fe-S cluster assembly protein HesB [Frankiaceae bacterium]MBV9368887.1 Fe-S cluster assembly protein HesB [Frankiales bacterium]
MPKKLCLAQNPDADKLLTESPLALLIGMVLDQQIPLEWAFTGPLTLTQRIGRDLDATDLANRDPDALAKAFSTPPALHRFPGSMAGRVQDMCRLIVEEYGGDPTRIWSEAADGKDLLKRIQALPGFGVQKAKIFLALLGKQYGVRPKGWREAAGDFGADGSYISIADIRDQASLDKVRAFKKQMKADAKAKAAAAT